MLSRQRSLVNSLIAAQEEERRAVAYDLHDG
jgi:signal transduction histidine kinase